MEDDLEIREALCTILEEEGYQVNSASHGLEALQVLEQEPDFCLILLDLMMPVMNGDQFAARREDTPRFRNVPFVVISADRSGERRARGIGASGFLHKPIDLSALLDTVQRHCQDGPRLPRPHAA